MPTFSSNVRFKKGLRGEGWATPEYYGVTGIGDDLPIFDAAFSDLTSSGGVLRLGPKVYRLDGLLLCPKNVSVKGVPGASWINWNHATVPQISFSQPSDDNPVVFEDISFIGNIGTSGDCIRANSGAFARFNRCSWNGFAPGAVPSTNLGGKILSMGSSSASVEFNDCYINVTGISKGLHATAGNVAVAGGRMIMPATYSDSLAFAESTGSITLDRVFIDMRAHVTGAAQGLYAATNDVNAFTAMRNCKVDATGATGTLTAFYWSPDANVEMWGNRLLPNVGVAPFGPNSAPSRTSLVELREYVQQDFSTSATVDLRNTYGYRTHLVRNDASTVSIILPAGVMDGQELDFIYYSGALVTAGNLTFATTKITAEAVPTVGAGNILTGHLRWAKAEATGDSDRWIQVGKWSVGTALV